MSVLVEPERRNVMRMAGVYPIVAWPVVHVARTRLRAIEATARVLRHVGHEDIESPCD